MGDFQLGALVGENQSFEAFDTLPTGWSGLSGQASFDRLAGGSDVHSSAFGLEVFADSTGGTADVIAYDYGSSGAAPRTWFPEVATHAWKTTLWARGRDAPSSGQLQWRVEGPDAALSAPIGHDASLRPYGMATWVTSAAGGPRAVLARITAANSRALVSVDDVLSQVDYFTVHPGTDLEWKATALRVLHRSRTGRLQEHAWHVHPEFGMPLHWLTPLQADLLNWWWEGQLPLALTLDTSDDAAVLPCRIVNPSQPIGRRMRPYADRWTGRLELAGLYDGRLSFGED
jgi:hypothetical protein